MDGLIATGEGGPRPTRLRLRDAWDRARAVSRVNGRTLVAPLLNGSVVSWPVSRWRRTPALRRQRPLAWAGLALAGCGLTLDWVRPLMAVGLRPADLPVWLPGNPLPSRLSYAWLVGAGALTVIAGMAIRGREARRRPYQDSDRPWLAAAGILLLTAALAFLLLTWTSDAALQLRLSSAGVRFSSVTSQLGYAVPRPQVDDLPFWHLSEQGSLLVSALRPGWFTTGAGGLVLLVAATRRSTGAERLGVRRALGRVQRAGVVGIALSLTVVLLFAVGIGRGALANAQADRAAHLVAQGRVIEGLDRYRSAFALNPRLTLVADVATGYGAATAHTGDGAGLYSLLAQARDLSAEGQDLTALQVLHQAHALAPHDALLDATQTATALSSALSRQRPDLLIALLGDLGHDDAAVQLTIGHLELVRGDDPTADADLRRVLRLTTDDDVRSAALTFAAVAEQRSGQLILARRTLVAALADDPQDRNLTARSMATGLFAAKDPG